ncbi:sulfatase-like hydrolase/transferase [Novipirellula sp. SH528]|uniref:sulfatase-like hydrolase/transferase n=1 Tax=Novipirellula sp. SH528 TaxID=3454466 RepID=UPI003F9F5C09
MSTPFGTGYKQGLFRNKKPAGFEGYLTDALSQDAVDFIDRNAEQDEPFFLYVGYNAPHEPLQAPEADINKYKQIEDPKRRVYAAMVHDMDRGSDRSLIRFQMPELAMIRSSVSSVTTVAPSLFCGANGLTMDPATHPFTPANPMFTKAEKEFRYYSNYSDSPYFI